MLQVPFSLQRSTIFQILSPQNPSLAGQLFTLQLVYGYGVIKND